MEERSKLTDTRSPSGGSTSIVVESDANAVAGNSNSIVAPIKAQPPPRPQLRFACPCEAEGESGPSLLKTWTLKSFQKSWGLGTGAEVPSDWEFVATNWPYDWVRRISTRIRTISLPKR